MIRKENTLKENQKYGSSNPDPIYKRISKDGDILELSTFSTKKHNDVINKLKK